MTGFSFSSVRRSTPPASPAAGRLARIVGIGAVATMLAAAPYRTFELDRFFLPKEAILLLTATLACWVAAPLTRRPPPPGSRTDRLIDGALVLYLVVSVASALLAPSAWLAARAVAASAGGAALFWASRAAARRGAGPAILGALVVAVALAAVTALAQAYGARSDYFSVNRAPGGTFGNRNFVAHLCAVGLPLAAYAALRARNGRIAGGASLTVLALGAMLVLSRSRGAWIAGAASAVPVAIAVLRAGPSRRVGRMLVVALALAGGTLAALWLPNVLDWRSDSPYLDSVRGVVDYRGGSGHGRLAQWQHSLRLVAANPVLGVGPGNWSVRYPAVAPPNDPSLTDERTTANPWPSSDWVAVVSERGVVGGVALATVMLGLALVAHRGVWGGRTGRSGRDESTDRFTDAGFPDDGVTGRVLAGGALGGVLAATLAAGAFDAVLLLAAPASVVWPAMGVLSVLAAPAPVESAGYGGGERSSDAGTSTWTRRMVGPGAVRLAALTLALGAALAIAHVVAMALFDGGAIRTAAAAAPGDYRIRLRAATLAVARGDCPTARAHAEAAHAMAPAAVAPRRVLAVCRRRPPTRA